MLSLSSPLFRRFSAAALSLICIVLLCGTPASPQTPSQPVPPTWLHDRKIVAPAYNFSLSSPSPDSQWSYARLADVEGSKATAFVVQAAPDTRFVVAVWDMPSSGDSSDTKKFVDNFGSGMKESMPKNWQIDDPTIEKTDFPLKDSLRIKIAIHRLNEATVYAHGYLVTGDRTYLLFDFSPNTEETPQFNRFVSSFAFITPPKPTSNLGYSLFHWLIVAALLGYIWLLVKFARPKPFTKPVTDSKAWLRTQTLLSWLCMLFFGFLTFAMLALNANRQRQTEIHRPEGLPGAIGFMVGYAFSVLGLPLFFALSVRWKRNVTNKKKALEAATVAATAPT
jgi:hypothetical protein